MITPKQVQEKAARKYLAFLHAFLHQENFFPLEIPFGKVKASDDYRAVKTGVQSLLKHAKPSKGYGYSLELQTRNTRRYGTQSLPSRICIGGEGDFLKLIGKEAEFTDFSAAVTTIRTTLPQLSEWVREHPREVLRHLGKWSDLLKVCCYFLEHPQPKLYIRELPIAVHSKFIEQNKGILRRLLDVLLPPAAICENETEFERRFSLRHKEALIRFRVLDERLLEHYHLPVSNLSVPVSQFAALQLRGHRFIITENEMTFLALPDLANSFGLFGAGFRVETLKPVTWLASCSILYWGDLDAQGFHILSQLRGSFPKVASVMMDKKTLEAFSEFVVVGTPSKTVELPHLLSEEREVYALLSEDNLRLEQERISHDYAVRELDTYVQKN